MIVLAVPAALASAAGFALSTSLQHRAAESTSGVAERAGALLRRLLRQPWWVAGVVVGASATALHGLALSQGALALVQPIVISGMVFAVPVRAVLDRRRPPRRDLGWAAVTAAGLGLFIVAASPSGSHHVPYAAHAAMLAVAGGVTALGLSWSARRVDDQTLRGVLFGAAAGLLFGVLAGMMKLTMATAVTVGIAGSIVSWPLWAMLVTGISAVALNQRAYQVAPLSATMPVLNVVAVLLATGFGFYTFGETLATQALAIAGQVAGLGLLAVGLWRLSRPPQRGLRPSQRTRHDLTMNHRV